ncbi:MAG: hypothetical protein Ct9H300mP29_6760 [Candidatus Neomarinimicrobiota bacterium]|nr:MAG: hypothetical protein Ct9H300mP29_6760 [Candidatus Neomarinimicrobiota bacterium]
MTLPLKGAYEVPMAGISEVVIPAAGFFDPFAPAAAGAPADETAEAPTTGSVTGLIIDCTGLGVRPAMSPQILDQNGGVIYGQVIIRGNLPKKMVWLDMPGFRCWESR